MKVIPKLNLNKNPQNCEEGSLMFAKNIKLDSDDTIVSDYGGIQIDILSDENIVGHIVGLDNTVYIFTHTSNISSIYEFDECTNTINKINCNWKYNGGEIDGVVTTNISGEKIITIAEYTTENILIPLKHINLSHCKNTDDESLYSQAPKVPMCNLTLNNTYAKTIPNGTYVFFIRYKFRKDCYTNWYLCSNPIFGGTSTKINTLQGGVKYIDTNLDSAKSFIFDVNFINNSAKTLYTSFQLGFILSHDDSVNARSWKEFSIDTTKVYFDYEHVEEIDIDEMLASTYELYNVRNVTSFKNKLYISNYIESDLNKDLSVLASNITLGYIDSHSNNIDYRTLKLNNISLNYNSHLGFYNKAGNDFINEVLTKTMISFKTFPLYKVNTFNVEEICSFNAKWDHNNEPDLCSIYNIINNAYNSAIFGSNLTASYDFDLGITITNAGSLYLCNRNTTKHPWDTLGFTFIYGSLIDDSIKNKYHKNNVYMFNNNSKIITSVDGSYWAANNDGFNDVARSFIINNIKREIENKKRFIYSYIEIISGTEVYKIDFDTYKNNNNYIGLNNSTNLGYDNANENTLSSNVEINIKDYIWNAIINNVAGINSNGDLILYIDGKYVIANNANVVFRSIKFKVNNEELINTEEDFENRYIVDAEITEWKSVCNFFINNDYLSIDDTNTNNLIQSSTLMPYSTYDIYLHAVDEHHIITNGVKIKQLKTNGIYNNTSILKLTYSLNYENINNLPYKGFFFSIINVGDYVMECFNYRKVGNLNIVNCLEIDSLLYNINDNITIKCYGTTEFTITNAKYYSSGSSYPTLAFGNCGFICWEGTSPSEGSSIFAIISRNIENEKNKNLIKCTPYFPLENTTSITVNNGFYNSYFCLIKKPDFDLSSTCYVSGKDVYNANRDNTLVLTEFKGYIQSQDSITYSIRSNFNLNYLSITEDISDQIFSVGSTSSGIKQVAKVINSAILSYIYELKNMYKSYRNKIFREYEETTKINFDNTIRVSNVLSDETFNNSIFKFLSTDYYNIPTDRGIIVKLFAIGNNIFVHTKSSLYKFDANQTLVSNESDISLKESEPFSNGITQICDSQYGYAGIDSKESGCITFDSYVFYDKQSNHLFGYSGQSQLTKIDEDIFKLLKYYSPINCRMIHDEKNNRIFINFIIDIDKEITISFNYKTKTFISIHDLTLNKAFNTKNKSYSYNNGFYELFDNSGAPVRYVYGGATKSSYLTYHKEDTTYINCNHSLSVLLFPTNSQRSCINSVQYNADVNVKSISSYNDKTKDYINFFKNTRTNPISEFFIDTDECTSNHIITNVDDSARPNSLLDYKGFKYNMGFWTSNYFRNILNSDNIYKYPNQPGVSNTEENIININTDNNSLVYGKYFILTFGFINTKPVKFENVLINDSNY